MKVFTLLGLALATTSTVLASRRPPPVPYRNGLFARDATTTGTCKIPLATSNGGRKVAIVIDSSGSMSSNDPSKLRVTAGKALNNQLVSTSGATGGKSADLVTVVDFDDAAQVIYPLGDPAGAGPSFDKIDSRGGTFIADGVSKATAELTKPGNDPTADRSGIVVLTDGEDSDTAQLITAINKAATSGIRVSFGFLAPSASAFKPDLLSAILKTGGSYASFETADAIQSWLFLILSNGITASDHASSSSGQPLLSGITIAKLSGSNPVTFTYAAQAGEKLVFSITSLSAQELSSELTDGSGAVVGSNKTAAATTRNKTPSARIAYDSTQEGTLKLVVAAVTNATSEGVFQVSLNSSLGISGCNLNTTTPPTGPNATATTSPPTTTPTSTGKPPVSTATAAAAKFGFPVVGLVLAAVLL